MLVPPHSALTTATCNSLAWNKIACDRRAVRWEGARQLWILHLMRRAMRRWRWRHQQILCAGDQQRIAAELKKRRDGRRYFRAWHLAAVDGRAQLAVENTVSRVRVANFVDEDAVKALQYVNEEEDEAPLSLSERVNEGPSRQYSA